MYRTDYKWKQETKQFNHLILDKIYRNIKEYIQFIEKMIEISLILILQLTQKMQCKKLRIRFVVLNSYNLVDTQLCIVC